MHEDFAEAKEALGKWLQRKARRGYAAKSLKTSNGITMYRT